MDADEVADVGRGVLGEVRDVEVRDAGIAAFGLARRPAHEFDAGEALIGREGQDFFEFHLGQDRGDESELHGPPVTRKSMEDN